MLFPSIYFCVISRCLINIGILATNEMCIDVLTANIEWTSFKIKDRSEYWYPKVHKHDISLATEVPHL